MQNQAIFCADREDVLSGNSVKSRLFSCTAATILYKTLAVLASKLHDHGEVTVLTATECIKAAGANDHVYNSLCSKCPIDGSPAAAETQCSAVHLQ